MNKKKPSETKRGRQWLTNFAAKDVPHAQLLIDSLYIPATDEIRQSIKGTIKSLNKDDVLPGLLLPVLSMEDIKAARERNEPGLTPDELDKPPVAYVDFHPGSDISSTPGSEAIIGNILRELTGNTPSAKKRDWFHPMTSVETLRAHRCRSIVLVTDYAGSGAQISNYARFLTRNRTIRSWRSLHYIRVVAVMHAASPQAIGVIKSSPNIDAYMTAHIAPSFATAQWTSDERAEIERLCVSYASGGQALGFRQSAGLLAMHSGIPNNLPMVLRKKGANWKSFFEGRTFPPDLAAELPSYHPDRNLASVAKINQQERLAKVIDSGRLGSTASQIAAALALIRRGSGSVDVLAASLGVSSERAGSIWRFLEEAGMVSGSNLTQRGLQELMAAKALPRKTHVSLSAVDEEPYYPQSLR